MKSLIAFMKSPVGKLHSSFALFILFNLITGFFNLLVRYTAWLAGVHFYTGLLIVAAPLLYLLASKNRSIAFTALFKMAMPNRTDFKKGKPVRLAFKLVTLLAVLFIFFNALTGIFMKLRVLTISSYNIHVFDFYALLALMALHAFLAVVMRAKRAGKRN